MKNKRITRAVAAVMLIALLIGVMPLVGLAETVTAETTELSTQEETQAPEEQLTEPTAAPSEATTIDPAAEQDIAPTETETPAEESEPEPEASEDKPSIEPTQPEGINTDPLSEDHAPDSVPPAADEIQAASAMLYKNYFLYGNGSTLSISFKYPGDTTNKTYTTSLQGMSCHFLNSVIAYCIEPQASSTAGDIYSEIAAGSSLNVWMKYLSIEQRRAITLALAYGAPNSLTSTNSLTRHGYEMATQVIVWEIIVGDRRTTPPYSRSNARLYNFYLPLMNTNDSSGVLRSAFIEGYNSIANAMKNHGKIPSFTSADSTTAPKYSMSYNASTNRYTFTLTDTNGVLSDFTFRNGGGITYSKSGNTLTITATKAALANAPVLVTATGHDPDPNGGTKVIWGTSKTNHEVGQILVQLTSMDPIPIYLKLDAAKGTAAMKKLSDNGNVEGYYFRLHRNTDDVAGYKNWYCKSDANGDIYLVNSNYSEPSSRNYTLSGLIDGTYTLVEVLSLKGAGEVAPDWVTITTSGGETSGMTLTINGDYRPETTFAHGEGDLRIVRSKYLTGLTGGGTLTITIHNAPLNIPNPDYGKITIGKQNHLGEKLSDVQFRLDFSLDNGTTWAPVFSVNDTDDRIAGSTLTQVIDGIIATDENGFAAFDGLCLSQDGMPIRYRLTEIATQNGYMLLAAPAYEGYLTDEENASVDLTVVNQPEFEMPMTGSIGFTAAAIGMGLFILAAMLLMLFLPQKREKHIR